MNEANRKVLEEVVGLTQNGDHDVQQPGISSESERLSSDEPPLKRSKLFLFFFKSFRSVAGLQKYLHQGEAHYLSSVVTKLKTALDNRLGQCGW